MAIKTVNKIFSRDIVLLTYSRCIKSQATCDPYERGRLIDFVKRRETGSPDAFFEFAKYNLAPAENFGLQ